VLENIGSDPGLAGWAAAAEATLGRVVRVDRGVASMLTEHGPGRAGYGSGLLRRIAADATAAPCTGDWCLLQDWPDHRVTLERVAPRRTCLVRATAGEQSHGQALCANIDLAAIVVALHPEPTFSKVERLLALAWESGAQPLVVLTKSDLAPDAALLEEDVAGIAPGVEVVRASTVTGEGVARLRRLLDGRLTMALVGASGHGKSSLTNALVGAEVLTTRAIRADGRGRHTSVRRELVVLPGGGAVIDTPGLRGIGLIDAAEGIAHAFTDVEALLSRCRFADCSHTSEPGCAVVEALEDGTLSHRRFESWQRMQREVAWMTARKDARLRADRVRDRRRRAGEARRAGR
jgi:ribosome biogenesis GTPase